MPSESLPGELLAAQTAVETLDRQFVFHPFTKLDDHLSSDAPVIVEGKGTTLRDSRGNVYLDAMAGLWCVNVGYGRREIAEALHDEALRLGYYHAFSSMATDLPPMSQSA
jgi:L-2,4-diaminobutyrate transaminase